MGTLEADPDIAAISRIEGVQTILEVVTAATGLRLALVARVTEDDWKACAVHDVLGFGLSVGGHLDVATTLCSEVRAAREPILIEHASQDATYCTHRTPKMYKFESYCAVPIFLANGDYFGNVCGLDSSPLPLNERRTREMMQSFAKLIGLQLEAQHTSDLREQFIAVLGHDLRNPLSAVMNGAEMLLGGALGDSQRRVVQRMQNSGVRMSRLIDDVTDFARGRLGSGIPLESAPIADLPAIIAQVVTEIRTSNVEREIRVRMDDVGPINGDRTRLGQLVSNLLANAVQHGAPGAPIHVELARAETGIRLSVRNAGEPIGEEAMTRMFQPFVRGQASKSASGLGLGLYIASEIARSHGGTLTVASTKEDGTTFTLTLPQR